METETLQMFGDLRGASAISSPRCVCVCARVHVHACACMLTDILIYLCIIVSIKHLAGVEPAGHD